MRQLASQYLHTAKVLDRRIARRRAELELLRGDDYLEACRRLDLLCQERYELRRVADHLLRHSHH